ncbi:putative RING-H2 finger protein ATL21A [Olea europaea var. sylvestris]|uniref:putative RING-H2 finger protein ATL21A n=1 Tax=Olea europaea var. sylvestris TaxID=158386 RepID=UPI000C1D65CF|nr:putative RING-H2 finger protein ATL21A [Olea europaea var. sylvestris]
METLALFFLFFFFSFKQLVLCADVCSPASCDGVGPRIRFPFRLIGRQPEHCGYPGFHLFCNNQSQTILSLPLSGEFVVDYIDYTRQAIFINDPDLCDSKRILNFSLSRTPFEGTYTRKFTFLNCSSKATEYMSYNLIPLFCLSRENYSVMAMPSYSSAQEIPPSCRIISNVSVPIQRYAPQYWSSGQLREDFQLTWNEPRCRSCEADGGICGFEGNTFLEVGCSRPANDGLPRSAKYGIIVGIGVPGLLCLIGLACFAFGRVRVLSNRSRLNINELPTITISQQPVVRAAGLDEPTIASYPMTVLGESRRFPKSSDGTCPICLSDYEPKETLRSIPECNHYFHAKCIDEWLKLNGTCPLCRNSPDSSVGTPCSSMSSSYSLSSSEHH